MGTKVYTESICELCGQKDRREGAEGDTLPVGWADASVTFRLKGTAWPYTRHISKTLCPKCAEKIEEILAGK